MTKSNRKFIESITIIQGSQGWNLEAGTEEEATGEWCQGLLPLLSYSTQDYLLRGGTAPVGSNLPP